MGENVHIWLPHGFRLPIPFLTYNLSLPIITKMVPFLIYFVYFNQKTPIFLFQPKTLSTPSIGCSRPLFSSKNY